MIHINEYVTVPNGFQHFGNGYKRQERKISAKMKSSNLSNWSEAQLEKAGDPY